MSDSRSERPVGAVLYSEKLLGLRGECSACGERERSTGWLLSQEGDTSRWYVDMKCTGCRGRGGTWKREWLLLIEEVLKAEGGRLMAAPSRPCTECGGGGGGRGRGITDTRRTVITRAPQAEPTYRQVRMMSKLRTPKTVMRYDYGREDLDQNAVTFLGLG